MKERGLEAPFPKKEKGTKEKVLGHFCIQHTAYCEACVRGPSLPGCPGAEHCSAQHHAAVTLCQPPARRVPELGFCISTLAALCTVLVHLCFFTYAWQASQDQKFCICQLKCFAAWKIMK